MATAAPILPNALPFDHRFSSPDEDFYQFPMGAQGELPNFRAQEYGTAATYGGVEPAVSSSVTHTNPGPKRARPASSDDDEREHGGADVDGRKKRSRGRPRLDTKDETAADRRRTQIRLAQRAYRHRKDTAITSLEQRVKELEQANEGMTKEFHQLYDLLLAEHVFDTSPQIVPRLTTIANRFINVSDKAKAGSADDGKSDGSDEPHAVGSATGMAGSVANIDAPATQASQQVATIAHTSPPLEMPVPTFSEGEVHNLNIAAVTSAPVSSAATTTTANTSAPPMVHVPTSMSYEVVTQPTPENASFPFYSSMKPESDGFPSHISPGPSPYGTLPVPASYGSHEVTFGRRLQRVTVERGLRLISMPNPPPDRFAAVFGFCLFFEPREAIINRLQLTLSRNQYEDLGHWRAPFTNLGGAGTFYPNVSSAEQGPNDASATMPIGNQGTRSYDKLQEMTGFSMGPFNAEVMRAREERVDDKMRMQWPGFEGEFFDTNEVEAYLRHLGVYIPPRAEVVEADVDLKDIEQELATGAAQPGMGSADSGYGNSVHNGTWTNGSNSPISAGTDPPASAALQQRQPQSGAMVQHAATSSPTEFGSNAMVSYVLPPGAQGVWSQGMNWPTRATISLNVDHLIAELASKSVCLGRSPGIRKKDILVALKAAAGLASSTPPVRY